MSRLIKNLSNKMTRLEVEGNNPIKENQDGGPRNPNQFKRLLTHILSVGKEEMKTNLFNYLLKIIMTTIYLMML
jgi:hypothetical protein